MWELAVNMGMVSLLLAGLLVVRRFHDAEAGQHRRKRTSHG